MTDDWPPPTGEHEQPCAEPAGPRHTPKVPGGDDELDPVFGVTAGELRLVDAFFHELALDAAHDPRPPTEAEQVTIRNLRARFERLKAMSAEEAEAERERLLRADRTLSHDLALEASSDPTPDTSDDQAEDDARMPWTQRLMARPPGGRTR